MDTKTRGLKARQLLEDEIFQQAVAEADARIVQDWREASDVKEQVMLHSKQEALQMIVRELRRFVAAGEMQEWQDDRDEQREQKRG